MQTQQQPILIKLLRRVPAVRPCGSPLRDDRAASTLASRGCFVQRDRRQDRRGHKARPPCVRTAHRRPVGAAGTWLADCHPMSAGDITALEARVRRDIEMTAHPRMEWMAPRLYRGKPALDALIVGAGQSGLCIAFALMRDRVRNILVIDRAPEGREGIWVSFARMPTLRSPKDQTGPDLGIPSLTFEAWYDAAYGAGSFAGLGLIPTGAWHDYLQWYRRVLALPVRNDVAATAIAPGRARRWRTLPAGDAVDRRSAGGAQAGAGHRPGRHRRMVDARLRARPAGGPPRPHLRDHRLRAAARADRRRAGRRRLGHGQCRRGARARRRGASLLPPRRAVGGAALPLADLRRVPEAHRRDAGRMALAGDGQHHARPRGFPGRHLSSACWPFPTSPCSSAAAGPMHAWRMAASGSRRRAGRSMPTTRSAAPASARTCGCALNWRRSPTRSRCGAIATRRRRARRIRCSRPIPISAPTTPSSRRTPGEAPWLADIHLFGIGSTLSFGPSGSSINAMTTARAQGGGGRHARPVRGRPAAALGVAAGLRRQAGRSWTGAGWRGG